MNDKQSELKIQQDANSRDGDNLYIYVWKNNNKRIKLKGRMCKIIAIGKKNTVAVQFLDNNQKEAISRRALRKVKD